MASFFSLNKTPKKSTRQEPKTTEVVLTATGQAERVNRIIEEHQVQANELSQLLATWGAKHKSEIELFNRSASEESKESRLIAELSERLRHDLQELCNQIVTKSNNVVQTQRSESDELKALYELYNDILLKVKNQNANFEELRDLFDNEIAAVTVHAQRAVQDSTADRLNAERLENERQRLEGVIAALQAQINAREAEIEDENTNSARLAQQLGQIENQHQQQLARAAQDNANLANQNADLTAELREREEEIIKLNDTLDQDESDIAELNAALRAIEQQINAQNLAIERLSTDRDTAVAEANQNGEELDNTEKERRKLEAQNQNLHAEVERLRTDRTFQDSLQAELAQVKVDNKRLEREKAAVVNEAQDLAAANDDLKDALARAQQDVETMRHEIERLSAELYALKNELEPLRLSADKLAKENDVLLGHNERLADATNKYNDLLQDIQNKQNAINANERQIQALITENQQLQTLNGELEGIAEEADELRELAEAHRQHFARAKDNLLELISWVKTEHSNSELQAVALDSSDPIEELRYLYAQSQLSANKYKSQVQRLTDNVNNLTTQLSALRAEMEPLRLVQVELRELSIGYTSLERQYNDLQIVHADTVANLEDLRRISEAHKRRVIELESFLAIQRDQVDDKLESSPLKKRKRTSTESLVNTPMPQSTGFSFTSSPYTPVTNNVRRSVVTQPEAVFLATPAQVAPTVEIVEQVVTSVEKVTIPAAAKAKKSTRRKTQTTEEEASASEASEVEGSQSSRTRKSRSSRNKE